MTTVKRSDLLQALSWLFLFLFVYTASSKLLDPVPFRAALSRSPLIGDRASFWSVVIPVAELFTAFLLVVERTRRAGIWGTLILMGLFTAYTGYMLLAVPQLPCSCGGLISALSWKQHGLLNGVLAGLAAWGCWLSRHPDPQNDKNPSSDPADPAGHHSIAQ